MPEVKEKRAIVTTSWDDGCRADLKLAEILRVRGIAGTFYVPIAPYGGQPSLAHADLRTLSAEGFEIGAHGVSHKLLWGLTNEELVKEIHPCKAILEDILGARVRMFCYPRGRYDSNVVSATKTAGYQGARTVRMLATQLEFDPFEMPTTLQAAPNPKSSYIKNALRARKLNGVQISVAEWRNLGNWVELGKRLFDSVLQHGGIWHLYGHSWEIDAWGIWDDVKHMLDYVAARKDVTYLPNWKVIESRSTLPTSSN